MKVDLSKFDRGEYRSGPKLKVLIWYFVNYYIFDSSFPWPYNFKKTLLLLFGARVGSGLVIKPKVRIKNPWRLTIGDNCWIGESVWIDNLENVDIGNNVSISQGAMLLTGNHDYTSSNFAYRLERIRIEYEEINSTSLWLNVDLNIIFTSCNISESFWSVYMMTSSGKKLLKFDHGEKTTFPYFIPHQYSIYKVRPYIAKDCSLA